MDSLATACRSPGWSPSLVPTEPAARDFFFSTILHSLPVGVCWQPADPAAACWTNEALGRLTGLRRETIGTVDALADSVHAEDRAAFAASAPCCVSRRR